MKLILNRLIFVAVLYFGNFVNAQTVNTGVMVIQPGTVVSSYFDFDNRPSGSFLNDGDFYVFKNFNNDGLVTFTPSGNGYTRFVGVSNQRITGSLPSELNKVLFENASAQPAFHLVGDVSISGNSEFSNGIVNNDAYGGNISYEQNATHSKTSDASHVDGHVIKNGNTAFIYPVGDKNLYRFAGISAPTEVAASFRGKYFFENSAPLYDHTQKQSIIEVINDKEYWTLDKTGGSSDVILTLSWDESTTTPANIVEYPQSAIHIVRWDDTRKIWVDEGGIVDETNRTVTTPVNVSGYSVFTTARVDDGVIILPCNRLVVYNALSPNGDGDNEFFRIDGLTDCASENTVEIYNRWGVKVFETKNYGNSVEGNVFKGYSDGRATISRNEKLPTGTYFYILNFKVGTGNQAQNFKKAGYLYISN